MEGITTLPSGVKRAFFKDPDGNIIGMRQLPGKADPGSALEAAGLRE